MPVPDRRPSSQSAAVTTGLKWAPEMGPNIKISTASPNTVAVEFSSSCSPTSAGDSCAAAMPEPTTTVTSSALPTNSATADGIARWCPSPATDKPIGLEQAGKLLQRFGNDPVIHPRAAPLTFEQSRVAQHLEVV